jgi:hypothetical protein
MTREPKVNCSDKEWDSVVTECPLKKKKHGPGEEKSGEISIRASLFFDGTCNNRTNVEHRMKGTDVYETHKDERSFQNDKTNIAKMEQYVLQGGESFSLYVEGPGTQDGDEDEFLGYAAGIWETGVKGKVEKGIEQLIQEIRKKIPNKLKHKPLDICLDVFGFSRGAASARHFIHEVMKGDKRALKDALAVEGYAVKDVKVRLAGLYDTVASFGKDHDDDTAQLGLNATKMAGKTLQLGAADEHRKNFSLTDISSAGEKGTEKFLPGVHSDIGGGYVDHDEERDRVLLQFFVDRSKLMAQVAHKRRVARNNTGVFAPIQTYEERQASKRRAEVENPPDFESLYDSEVTEAMSRLEAEKKRLVEAGWHKEEELRIERAGDLFRLKADRKGIRNAYSRIPFHIMAKFAREGEIAFKEKDLAEQNQIPRELNKVKDDVDWYMDRSEKSRPGYWAKNSKGMRWLRHKYLHFSAYYDNDIVNAHQPRFSETGGIKDKRERKIHEG